jgi:hypothetical protein
MDRKPTDLKFTGVVKDEIYQNKILCKKINYYLKLKFYFKYFMRLVYI